MFGGGLSATIQGGSISSTAAAFGVVALANTTLTVTNTTFADNVVDQGALYASWASRLQVSSAKFLRNSGNYGAAAYVVGANMTLFDSHFDSNVAKEAGGALHVKFSNVSLNATKLVNNSAPTGGALAVYEGSSLLLEGTHVADNTARIVVPDNMRNYYKLGIGGAMYMEQSMATILRANVSGNRAVMDGGAHRREGRGGGRERVHWGPRQRLPVLLPMVGRQKLPCATQGSAHWLSWPGIWSLASGCTAKCLCNCTPGQQKRNARPCRDTSCVQPLRLASPVTALQPHLGRSPLLVLLSHRCRAHAGGSAQHRRHSPCGQPRPQARRHRLRGHPAGGQVRQQHSADGAHLGAGLAC